MMDPTYDQAEINAKPEWKLAFKISEWINDNAPLGWNRYTQVAKSILEEYEPKVKP